TQLQTPCAPALAGDQTYRCVPNGGADTLLNADSVAAPYFFEDAACAVPIAMFAPCITNLRFAVWSSLASACFPAAPSITHIWALKLVPISTYYFKLNGYGDCTQGELIGPPSGPIAYEFREMQPYEFVKVTLTTQ